MKDGLQRMLEFLDVLREKGIHYRIERQSPDALMVTFSLGGVCIEVNFFVDEIEFSYFKGAQGGEMSDTILKDLLRENWSD